MVLLCMEIAKIRKGISVAELPVPKRKSSARIVFRALQKQLDLNASRNLLHSDAERLLDIDETFLAALEGLATGSAGAISCDTIDRMAADAATSFAARIQALNQYIQIDRRARESLKQIYVETWRHLVQTGEVESSLRSYHFPKIKAFMEEIYPQTLAAGLRSATQLRRVPGNQYSAELQLRLLKLEPATAAVPFLDIGCGTDAILVRFLRSRSVLAYGIDRSIKHKSDYLAEVDWFEYDYGHRKWGTVVSHLSLANHLVYAQRYDDAMVPRYLKTFTRVLDSISHGGTLTFAPAVELLESRVDKASFRIDKWQIPPTAKVMRITRISP